MFGLKMCLEALEHHTYSSSSLFYNFILFCVLYSITHATVDAVLAFSSAELGVELGSTAGFVLYIVYTLSSLLLAKPILHIVGAKMGAFYGLFGMVVYVTSFYLAVLFSSAASVVFPLGAAVGGLAAGVMWTSQGSYFSMNAARYASSLHLPISERTTTNFAAIFAAFYLSFETGFKLIATLIFVAAEGSGDGHNGVAVWRMTVFGLYTAAALLSVVAFYFCIMTMNSGDDNRAGGVLIGWEDAHREQEGADTGTIVFSDSDADRVRCSGRGDEDYYTLAPVSSTSVGSVLNDALAVIRALWTCRRLQCLVPYQVCFGVSAGFMGTYVHGVIVKEQLGDGYIGLLSGLSILTAVLLTYPFALVSNHLRHGTYYIMVGGGVCFALGGLALLCLSDSTLGQWGLIVPYFMIHGAARGIWENTNKAVVAEYFQALRETDCGDGTVTRDVAYASVYFASGLAGAVGYLFFKFMSRDQLAVLNIAAAVLAVVAYHLSYTSFAAESRRDNAVVHSADRNVLHKGSSLPRSTSQFSSRGSDFVATGVGGLPEVRYDNLSTSSD